MGKRKTDDTMTTKTRKKRIRRTPEYFEKEVSELTNGEYTPMSPFVRTTEKVAMLHRTCGNTWMVTPRNFIHNSSRCPRCFGNYSPSTEEYSQKIDALTDGEYVVQGDYKDALTKIPMFHDVCGNTWEVTPSSFLHQGSRCPHCSGNYSPSTEDYKATVFDIVGNEYSVEGGYINNRTPIPMRHTSCGHVWSSSPNSFIHRGTRCPNCVYSRGEKAVADTLDSLDIRYNREHIFGQLPRKRFDFYLPVHNIAIEYDGSQHFKAFEGWGGEEKLKRIQESDAIKTAFCVDQGIPLLRIPYWEFDNVEQIVKDFVESVKQPQPTA